jgi:hypothetical protein
MTIGLNLRKIFGVKPREVVWQNHLINEGFVFQDHIEGFSAKREYTNTSHKAYNTIDMKFK